MLMILLVIIPIGDGGISIVCCHNNDMKIILAMVCHGDGSTTMTNNILTASYNILEYEIGIELLSIKMLNI